MNGPYAEEYWIAVQIEIETLKRIKAWTVVPRTDDITNVLPSTWAFKVKRYPYGTVKKFKGRFCARGDKQIEGIDFFETYSPVVQWTTIRLMLVLEFIYIGIDTYPDADFAGLYGYKDNNDPVCVRSRTGYVITVSGCPIYWSSKLQNETATSTLPNRGSINSIPPSVECS